MRGLVQCVFTDLRYGPNHGHPTTPIAKAVRPSQRKGVQSTKTKFVRSVIREVAGFSAYERRVMELLRNSKVRPSITTTISLPVTLNQTGQEGQEVDQEEGMFFSGAIWPKD
jgi:Ribosomal protein L36e